MRCFDAQEMDEQIKCLLLTQCTSLRIKASCQKQFWQRFFWENVVWRPSIFFNELSFSLLIIRFECTQSRIMATDLGFLTSSWSGISCGHQDLWHYVLLSETPASELAKKCGILRDWNAAICSSMPLHPKSACPASPIEGDNAGWNNLLKYPLTELHN